MSDGERARGLVRGLLRPGARRRLRRALAWPPVGAVELGSLRRTTPISANYGFDRGTPIDRYYIERFLRSHTADIRGRVLEIGDDDYTYRFGGSRVDRSDVLDAARDNPKATIVADIAHAPEIESNTFNCIICTQVLLLVYDVRAAIATLERILAPGGVLLLTVPGVSRICRPEADTWGDWWRFTTMSLRRLLEERFPASDLEVEAYGNVLTATAMLHGLAAEELGGGELSANDPDFEVTVAARAEKLPW
ncbi:MAG: class I SAM-dependent methyltransferase [Thermoleophilaceae bacterium]